MSVEQVLTNARVVTRRDVMLGTVVVRDGVIRAVEPGAAATGPALDLEGDYLLPGLVELHTDNLERNVAPRPRVKWPTLAAVVAHDAQLAAAGITTVFDAIAIGDVLEGTERLEYLMEMTDAVREARTRGLFRAEHLLHMRCEVSYEGLVDLFAPFAGDPLVRLVSIMDHSPGQRQFVRLDMYREYYQGKYKLSDAEMERFIARRIEAHRRLSGPNRAHVVAIARARGITLASHDDATAAHVEEAVRDGVAIAEFPTTVEAAAAARRHGLRIVMGAPNVVRGGSHSGNVSATALAARGLLDVLSSDYVPSSLLHAAFLLADRGAMSLPDAVALVSASPAAAAGLEDRGEVVAGKRADLVRVRREAGLPLVRAVWRGGRRMA